MQLSSLFHVKYRRFLFKVNDSFMDSATRPDADINYYIQCPENVGGALEEFYTLLIDLNKPREVIWKGIYHRTQAEILSFINNQAYEHRFIETPTVAELTNFVKLFNEFAFSKGIRRAETFRLEAYRKNGVLALSYIKQGDYFLCINFYRVNRKRATNLYSFSLKDTWPAFNGSHYGRAHRALHWLDILFFKQEGVQHYDFCGWYDGKEDKALLNINKFKEQFTSHKVKEYSGVIYNNRLLSLIKKLR